MSVFESIFLFFFASQLYWGWRCYRLLGRRGLGTGGRAGLMAVLAAVWFYLFEYSYGGLGGGRSGPPSPVHLTLAQAVLAAPFQWWAASSLVAFLVALLIGMVRAPLVLARKLATRHAKPPASPARRHFLEQATVAAPFVAGAYGLLYGRLNLETTQQPVRIPRLPAAFEGFRICQLSDIHIGPFMPAEEIRKYVSIANSLQAQLIVLTGDYVTFDGRTQFAAVDSLRGLRAPFGVYGCLGNHDAWCRVEDSITALFRQTGVKILRGENVAIAAPGNHSADPLNLIGVDFQSRHRFGPSPAVPNLLGNIQGLISRDRVNILLSHNPDTFDRAAQLGVDFSLAGHTHGGQAALEFISPELAPSRLVTPYVAGLFRKPGSQLYVNRGIGTIGIPMRIGAPPEITVYTLTRG